MSPEGTIVPGELKSLQASSKCIDDGDLGMKSQTLEWLKLKNYIVFYKL